MTVLQSTGTINVMVGGVTMQEAAKQPDRILAHAQRGGTMRTNIQPAKLATEGPTLGPDLCRQLPTLRFAARRANPLSDLQPSSLLKIVPSVCGNILRHHGQS